MKYICPWCETVLPNSDLQECSECKEYCYPIITKETKTQPKSNQPLKRTKLKPVSSKQSNLLKSYKSSIPLNEGGCAKCNSLDELQKHHPYGRSATVGDQPAISLWIWLCSKCHTWVHEHANQAYELGWLQPEYRRQKGNSPKPWIKDN